MTGSMKLYNYDNVTALQANQHSFQIQYLSVHRTGSMKLYNYDNVTALQANQHNFQKYNTIIISTQDCLYKTIQLRQCDELHLHLIILSKNINTNVTYYT